MENWLEIGAEEVVLTEETSTVAAEEAATSSGRARIAKRSGKICPFGLETEQVATVQGLVQKHPELATSMKQLLNGPLAESTMKGYDSAVKKFKNFCEVHGYGFDKPTEAVLMHYLAQLNADKVSFAVLCQVRPAIQLLIDISETKEQVFTTRVERMLEAAKRVAAETKEPVKKAGEASLDLLKNMAEKHINPFVEDIFQSKFACNSFGVYLITWTV